jgi:hypothetical protein
MEMGVLELDGAVEDDSCWRSRVGYDPPALPQSRRIDWLLRFPVLCSQRHQEAVHPKAHGRCRLEGKWGPLLQREIGVNAYLSIRLERKLLVFSSLAHRLLLHCLARPCPECRMRSICGEWADSTMLGRCRKEYWETGRSAVAPTSRAARRSAVG